MMKNILVTGGAGFIGSNFIAHLFENHGQVNVINLDSLTYSGSKHNLADFEANPNHIFIHGDIRDRELLRQIFDDHSIDTVAHFAAETHVDRSINAPLAFLESNVRGTVELLETAKEFWLEDGQPVHGNFRFLHVSTDEVYGSLEQAAPASSEGSSYAPNSPYAASKASGDHFVRAYHATYRLPAMITNCSNNYGPRQYPEKLIPFALLNLLQGNPVPIYGDGKQIRDWLYVKDHCRALVTVLESGRIGRVYNIGGENQTTNLALVKQLVSTLNSLRPDAEPLDWEAMIKFVANRPGHDRRYALDTARITKELGWKPQHNLASGLRETVAWYLDNLDWLFELAKDPGFKAWTGKNYFNRSPEVC